MAWCSEAPQKFLRKNLKDNLQKFFGVWPFFTKKGQILGKLFMNPPQTPQNLVRVRLVLAGVQAAAELGVALGHAVQRDA